MKSKFWTACKETGDKIEQFDTSKEAAECIKLYEEQDKADGDYSPDFYDIVNDEYESVKW